MYLFLVCFIFYISLVEYHINVTVTCIKHIIIRLSMLCLDKFLLLFFIFLYFVCMPIIVVVICFSLHVFTYYSFIKKNCFILSLYYILLTSRNIRGIYLKACVTNNNNYCIG